MACAVAVGELEQRQPAAVRARVVDRHLVAVVQRAGRQRQSQGGSPRGAESRHQQASAAEWVHSREPGSVWMVRASLP